MTKKRLGMAIRALALGSLVLPLVSCGPGTESADKANTSDTERVRNGMRGDGFAGIGDSQGMAMGLATSLFNDVMRSMFGYKPLDPLSYAEKDRCTPRDRNNNLINPSLAGCVYTYNPVWTASMKFGFASQSQSDHNAKQWDNDFKTHMANFLPMVHNFREHSLNGATFKDINLSGDDISGAVQPAGETFAGSNVTGARSYAADFVGADFTGATFINASFKGVSLYGAKLSGLGSKITTLGDLSQSELDAADLSGLDLRQVNLPTYYTEGANMSRTNLSGKNMSGMFLHGVNFSGADLSGTNLSNVFAGRNRANDLDRYGFNVPVTNFTDAKLVNANLAGGRFTLVNFNGADLRGVNFAGAKLNGATFVGARFGCIGDKCTNFTGADLGCATWVLVNQEQELSNCSNPSNTNIVRTDFSDHDLQNVIFDGATLDAALFNGANLKRASFVEAHGIRQPQFENVDISGANFRGAYFRGIRLINANGRCLIDICTDFTNAYFDSSFGGQETIEFYAQSGKGSDFSGAYFNNASLFNARVQGVNFTNATFQCAQLRSRIFVGNNLQAADLSGAFTDADIVVPATAGDRPRNEGTPAVKVAVTCPASQGAAVPNPPRALPPVPPAPPTLPADDGTCRAGGVCKVGNIGPGGGYVFYVSPTPINFASGISNGGIYLEMAYKGWDDLLATTNDPANRYVADPQLKYECFSTSGKADQGNSDFGIGFGAINTKKLLETHGCAPTDTNTLVGRIANATISKQSDWFLPSADELELMANTIGAAGLGGFFPNTYDGLKENYASSTQGPADAIFNSRNNYVARSMPGTRDGKKYLGGKVFFRDKYNQNGDFDYARPIRAFSPTDWSQYEPETGTSGGVSVATTSAPTTSSSTSTTVPISTTTVPRTTVPASTTTQATTTQPSTTTVAAPTSLPLVNPTFSSTGGGWVGTGFTLGSGCKASGGNPSLGTWNANSLSFGYSNRTVTQSVTVPKPGKVTFTANAAVRGDRANGFFSFALADTNENVTSGNKTGSAFVAKAPFALSVTTTAANERVTISITGGTTGAAWAGCYGPIVDSANLTVTSK